MQQNKVNDILRQCQRSERSAQQQLYQTYFGFAYSVASRYTNNEADSREVIQDVFLKVFNNLNNYNFDYPFEPWFKKIIVRTCIDRYRSKQRQIETVELEQAIQEDYLPESLINADAEHLLGLVKKLSPAYRTAFSMYAIDGYEYQEIADNLGVSIGSVKSNISKARAYLKQWILEEKRIDI